MNVRVVVAAAIVVDGRLLLAQRRRPAELEGLWELPGGKVEAGETPTDALRRELREELDIETEAGERIGVEVPLADGLVLRAYLTELVSGTPRALDHAAIGWFSAAELPAVDLVPNDRMWLPELERALRAS
ncbi:(deoxy)nucleoside triphosphate pyrophosphohydrolase [Antrihabitans spumae]|jgi:8-oxo-dGTP diphosphatase|uniref:8-oxo-dGTP diphosphatase n=1 Tax=Antrihabitans spumae TaxID=3373370 RepID=A0ABW7JRM7_9NOCA